VNPKDTSVVHEEPLGHGRSPFPWEAAAVDKFVVEWQLTGGNGNNRERSEVLAKLTADDFIADWAIIDLNSREQSPRQTCVHG
jgi:hypothetical protein